jgi:glycosyltransferase involved in cell wall biosynthesis
LFVGRVTPEKGLDQLIDIINLTETKPTLLIAGADGLFGSTLQMHEIIKRADDIGINYEIIGWKRDIELKKTYLRSMIIAVCSIWPEPFGLVGIEAMASKRPVVAFDVGGVAEWLQDGQTGFLVQPGDLNAFAKKIDQLVLDAELRERFSLEAEKQCIKKFSQETYAHKLLTIYKETISERSSY